MGRWDRHGGAFKVGGRRESGLACFGRGDWVVRGQRRVEAERKKVLIDVPAISVDDANIILGIWFINLIRG